MLGKRSNTVETGINRETRRKYIYPKTVEVDKSGVKLREEFGVVGVALATGIVIEDVKNNDTVGTRAGVNVIDVGVTAGAYLAIDYDAGVGQLLLSER